MPLGVLGSLFGGHCRISPQLLFKEGLAPTSAGSGQLSAPQASAAKSCPLPQPPTSRSSHQPQVLGRPTVTKGGWTLTGPHLPQSPVESAKAIMGQQGSPPSASAHTSSLAPTPTPEALPTKHSAPKPRPGVCSPGSPSTGADMALSMEGEERVHRGARAMGWGSSPRVIGSSQMCKERRPGGNL